MHATTRISARRFWLMLSLATAVAATPVFASVQGSFERAYTVTGPVNLEVLTRSGDITVRSGPAGTVTVRGKIEVSDRWLHNNWQAEVRDIENNPPIRQSGSTINIEYTEARALAIDYEITVPRETTVHTHSGSGDQRVEDLNGNLTLEAGSGDMRLRGITGDLDIHTGSGDVEAHQISGAFHGETGSGDVRLDETGKGDVRVRTGSGTVELRDLQGTLQAESGSGDVRISGTQTGTWEVRTGSGNVDLDLPQGAAFDLSASTGSGELEVGRGITMVVEGVVREPRHHIEGKVGGGGPELRITTSSGDVRIN